MPWYFSNKGVKKTPFITVRQKKEPEDRNPRNHTLYPLRSRNSCVIIASIRDENVFKSE